MSSSAYSESECKEVYEYLKGGLPDVLDSLLKEIAYNPIHGAILDIDIANIISVLSPPWPLDTFTLEFDGEANTVLQVQDLIAKIAEQDINLRNAAGLLFIINSNVMTLSTFNYLMKTLNLILHPKTSASAAWYADKIMGTKVSIRVIYSGIVILEELDNQEKH